MNNPKIIAEITAKITLAEPAKVEKEDVYFDVGGYEFKVKDKNVQFDFTASGQDIEMLDNKTFKIEYTTGQGLFFNDNELDECHEESWAEQGLTRADLTAEFLASTDEITEIWIAAGWEEETALQEVVFEKFVLIDDATGKIYEVSKEALKAYSEKLTDEFKQIKEN